MYFDGIVLSEMSRNRLSFFMKIEEIQCALLLSFASRIGVDTFIDIGGNVGFYSLLMKKYFSNVSVICFEPTPDTFQELDANFLLNAGLSGSVTLRNLAVSSTADPVRFVDFGDCSGKNAVESTCIHAIPKSATVIEVATLKLDAICGQGEDGGIALQRRKLVLKIDTEGHELDVLVSGSRLLQENDCLLQIEEGHKNPSSAIGDLLASYGYKRIFTAGPDSYFTNINVLQDPVIVGNMVESGINFLIGHRWGESPLPSKWPARL